MPAITQSTKDFSDAINNISRSANFSDQKLDILASHFGDVDASVINAAKSLQRGEISLDTFNTTIKKSVTATTKFGAALKSFAANAAIMVAITAGIKLIAFTYDQIAHRQENLNEKATESTRIYEELQSEVGSLNEELV